MCQKLAMRIVIAELQISCVFVFFTLWKRVKPHLFVILTAIGWFIVNIQSDLFWHRCLERQAFCTPRMYTLSPSKSIKGSNYGEFLTNFFYIYQHTDFIWLFNIYRASDKLRICVFYAMKTSKNACIIRSECTHYPYILLCKQTFQESASAELYFLPPFIFFFANVVSLYLLSFVYDVQLTLIWRQLL
jgi:hypothetical protein